MKERQASKRGESLGSGVAAAFSSWLAGTIKRRLQVNGSCWVSDVVFSRDEFIIMCF